MDSEEYKRLSERIAEADKITDSINEVRNLKLKVEENPKIFHFKTNISQFFNEIISKLSENYKNL